MHRTRRCLIICLFVLYISLTILLLSGCRLNPVTASNVVSGSDTLFAAKNNNATFTFQVKGETYGSFRLSAYVLNGYLSTPQGGGVQKSTQNLGTAPESGYIPSEECSYYYYYMITDLAPHYAKVFIHTITQDQDGITIGFNWWLQTQAGERNFQ